MPDSLIEHRAAAIASLVDLGDWSILIDPTAEELAEIYADGLTNAAELANFDVSVEQVNDACS